MNQSGLEKARAGADRPTGRRADPVDVAALRARLEDAEATLRAIRSGEIDAIMVDGPNGPRVYTLLTADQTYRTLVEQMRDAALTLSEDGLILYCNSHLSSPLGLGREEVAGKHLVELAAPEHQASLEELLRRGREEATSGEVWLQHADGETVPFHISLSPLDTDSFSGICAVATDLTEQKARARAAAEEQLTRAIVEFAGTAILVCDGDGRIIRTNPQAVDLLGDVRGRSCEEVLSLERPLAELAATGAPCELELDHEGGAVYLLAGVRPLDELLSSERARWVVTLTDVTVLRRAEQEAARASRAKSQFLAVMSHELRTPLTSIVGYAEMASGISGPVNEAQRENLQRVKQNALHLRDIIDDILALARSDSGRETVHLEVVDATAVMREAAVLLGAGAGESGDARFRVELPGRPVPILTDAAKLRQVLLNLTGNALKFSDDGEVVLSLEETEGAVAFHVRDRGPGIDGGLLDRIFEPFWQIDQSDSRERGGAGLGLAIVKRYVDLLEGEVMVDSAPGAGSTFTVRLPRREPAGS